MPISLFVSTPVSKLAFVPATGALEIPLDASISEDHLLSNNVTQFPVEAGSNISDHISTNPTELNIVGFVTNAPVRVLAGLTRVTDDLSGGDRVQTAYQSLITLNETKQTFTVVTGLTTYDNMFFTSLRFPQDANIGKDNLRFTAQLTQLEFAVSEFVTVDADQLAPTPSGTLEQGQTTKNLGKQVTSTPTQAIEGESSFAFDFLNGIGVF